MCGNFESFHQLVHIVRVRARWRNFWCDNEAMKCSMQNCLKACHYRGICFFFCTRHIQCEKIDCDIFFFFIDINSRVIDRWCLIDDYRIIIRINSVFFYIYAAFIFILYFYILRLHICKMLFLFPSLIFFFAFWQSTKQISYSSAALKKNHFSFIFSQNHFYFFLRR